MILKLLLIIGVIALVYFMFIKKKPLQNTTAHKDEHKAIDADEMVACATCELYISVEEALLSNGHYYCSRECMKKGK